VALAEMAMASGASGIGAEVAAPEDVPLHAWLFGEDQGRYVLTTVSPERVLAEAAGAGVPAAAIGTTGGAALVIAGAGAFPLAELAEAHESWLPHYMAGE
jgi:phosphoribosylformylglycinamidine synthase